MSSDSKSVPPMQYFGPTDVFVADVGDEHVAHPIGAARILVVERKGSV